MRYSWKINSSSPFRLPLRNKNTLHFKCERKVDEKGKKKNVDERQS